MAPTEIDLDPVSHITTDAIGKPGMRVFYIQAWQENRVITLLVEKVQIQTLSIGVEHFLRELRQKYPELTPSSGEFFEEKMSIQPPVDPLFRVGELGLAYETELDKVVLIAREIPTDQEIQSPSDGESARIVRFWCTRSQIEALALWGLEITARGRARCPQCGEPMDPEGHFCPKKNGHKS